MNECKNNIVLFKSSDGAVSLPVEFGKGTAWLTQVQMAQLFGKDRTVHVRILGVDVCALVGVMTIVV